MQIINLIIPLYNSNYIEKQLLSIKNLEKNNINLNIIYIDDGSDDLYKEKYQQLIKNSKDLNIIYHFIGEKNGKNRVSQARNLGVEKSIGENLIFIDQETILEKKYFKKLLKNIDSNEIIIGPYYGYNNLEKEISENDIDFFKENGYINKNNFLDFRLDFFKEKELNNRIWEFFCASNLFIKKYVYNSIGGFDENIDSWGDEDVEFGYRLYKAGYKIIFKENMGVLNLSEKLYKNSYRILEKDKICFLSENWEKDYQKHNDYEYKRYIFDRFDNFDVDHKRKVGKNFSKNILNHSFYEFEKDFIFFRIDDAKELSINFIKLINIFIKYKFGLVIGVEPANINNETIEYLNNLKEKYGEFIDIVQHGYNHNNYSEEKYKYEFGDNRTYFEQSDDIELGLDNMKKHFGNNFFQAFIPPFNNYCKNTEKILGEKNFKVLSSGFPKHEYNNYNFETIQLHAFLDLISDYNNIKYKTFSEIILEYLFFNKRDGFVGITIHPQFLDNDSFKLIIAILEYIRIKQIEVLNFNTFLKKYKYD